MDLALFETGIAGRGFRSAMKVQSSGGNGTRWHSLFPFTCALLLPVLSRLGDARANAVVQTIRALAVLKLVCFALANRRSCYKPAKLRVGPYSKTVQT